MEECHSDLVSEVQRERVLSEAVFTGLCDIDDPIQNTVKPELVDESVVRCYGWMEYLGDRERRAATDHRVHRERNHDGTVFSSSDVDISGESGQKLEEDTVVQRKDSICFFGKH